MSRGRSKALSRVLGHHLAANPSEGLVEEARMTECDVSVPFWPDDLSELVSFRNNPLFEIAIPSEGLRNKPTNSGHPPPDRPPKTTAKAANTCSQK